MGRPCCLRTVTLLRAAEQNVTIRVFGLVSERGRAGLVAAAGGQPNAHVSTLLRSWLVGGVSTTRSPRRAARAPRRGALGVCVAPGSSCWAWPLLA